MTDSPSPASWWAGPYPYRVTRLLILLYCYGFYALLCMALLPLSRSVADFFLYLVAAALLLLLFGGAALAVLWRQCRSLKACRAHGIYLLCSCIGELLLALAGLLLFAFLLDAWKGDAAVLRRLPYLPLSVGILGLLALPAAKYACRALWRD